MRQIKFRVWENPQLEYNQDGSNGIGFAGRMWIDNDPKFWAECMMNEKDEYVLMQFTGLFDKNGKEIFEGDIIRNNSMEWWQSDGRTFNQEVIYDLTKLPTQRGEWSIDVEDYEISGNIYQNPELLK